MPDEAANLPRNKDEWRSWMTRSAAKPLGLMLAALLGGCSAPHRDTVMQGDANGVTVNYFGDLAETLPLARQFCARYERVPVLHETKNENAYYFCVKPADAPH
ncbi:MAG TPA: hypothetical protein VME45_17655 [Stellaceae bacterium]|nr:hypothetical protein [Stellaceae bacterium]